MPVGLSAALVPGARRRVKLVIGFRVIRAIITRRPEVLAKALYVCRGHTLAAHVMGPDSSRVHPGDDTGACRGTNTGVRIYIVIAHALGCKLVDIGRYSVTITITA
ncbi:hypothetical protein ES703_123953 [subsurface metagenome]